MGDLTVVPYDVKLNDKKYLLLDNSYHELPVRETIRPLSTPGGDREFRDNDNPAWAWWGQSNWEGEGSEDWEGDGAYYQGVGMSLENGGRITNATNWNTVLSDAANADGFLFFTVSNGARLVAVSKSSGQVYYTDGGITFTSAWNLGSGARSWAQFQGYWYLGNAGGGVWRSNDVNVTTWTQPFTSPSALPAYVLGTYRSKLYISWGGLLKTWDGTTLANPGGSTTEVIIEGVPVVAAVGAGVFFILCQGNPARLYMMQGDQLSEMAQWTTDFQPDDAVFTDTLHIVGGAPAASGGQYGQRWRYTSLGIELEYEFPEIHGAGVDYRIRSLGAREGQLLYSYNKGYGYGVYDGTLDIWEEPRLGTAIGSRTNDPAAGAARVIGIIHWAGMVFMGVTGVGIVRETGFCNFQVTSSLFGSVSKRVNKMWGTCELTYAVMSAGQSVTVEYSRDGGGTWSLLGTTSYDALDPGKTKSYFDFPSNYLAPMLQYRITGYAANAPLTVLDVSFSFIEASANPKRMWRFVIELYGDDEERMLYRDETEFERTSKQMKDELDLLWNKRFNFEDVFGKTYTVMMPAPHTSLAWVVRNSEDADPDSVTGVEAQYQVTLVEV